MHVERVQVDGGFLDNLDICFKPGLNVLIGARGTGKTSLIELIRFGLGAVSLTQGAAKRGNEQAKSVLQGGQVIITLRDGEARWIVTRDERDERPRSERPIPSIMILAQSEIEAVGAQASGRLELIDRLRPHRAEADRLYNHNIAILRSITSEIGGILAELSSVGEKILEVKGVREEKSNVLAQQQELLESAKATDDQRQEVERLRVHAGTLSVREGIYNRTGEKLSGFINELTKIEKGVREIEEWHPSAGETDLLTNVKEQGIEAATALSKALAKIENAGLEIETLKKKNIEDRANAEERARTLRRDLNKLDVGVGELTRRLTVLTERETQLDLLEEQGEHLLDIIAELQEGRRKVFESVEIDRLERFESRKEVANALQASLSPKIKIKILQAGITDEYTGILLSLLRGSGLHYSSLAPHITKRMSPLEIVEAVESSNVRLVTEAVEIDANRAARVIAHLQSRDLSDLIAAPIHDAVDLFLLDGVNYKKSDNLSIGQRCTVVLPFLLSSHGGLLAIDQPEDHLDNAFITGTLIENLRTRHRDSQFIFASHNANIPVLGEADLVVRLDSDGHRGFVQHAGPLDDHETAKAITSLLEGGAEAFRRRAKFYDSLLDDEYGY